MRLWSIHPKYLDPIGLVACWREALLAKTVLNHKTKGYQHHPQLLRFRQTQDPIAFINAYLYEIYKESLRRGYHFSQSKLGEKSVGGIPLTQGQLQYEWDRLKQKLSQRNKIFYALIQQAPRPQPHPLFYLIEGDVESWEKR